MKWNCFTSEIGNLSWLFLLLAVFFSPLRCYGLFTIGAFTGSLFKIFALLMIVTAFVCYLNKIICDFTVGITLAIIGLDLFAFAQSSSLGLFPSYFVSHIVFLFGYIVIQNSSKNGLSLVKAYVYGSIIPGVLGLFQWISVMRGRGVPELPLKRFVTTVGKDDIFLYGNYRVVGTLQDPSYYGLFMASVFVLCVGLIISGKIQKKIFEKVVFTLIMFMSLLCVFTSGSVSSMIAAVSGLAILLYSYRADFSAIAKYIFFTIVVSIGVFMLMYVFFNYNPIDVLLFKLKYQGAENASAGALYGRGHFFQDAINDFWESPIWGVGFGNMTRSSGHNSYLTILALQGFLGFILHAFLLVVYPTIQYIKINFLSVENNLLVICYATLVGMAIQVGGYDCLYKMDPTVVILLLFYSTMKNCPAIKLIK